jgi:hypothetical protein
MVQQDHAGCCQPNPLIKGTCCGHTHTHKIVQFLQFRCIIFGGGVLMSSRQVCFPVALCLRCNKSAWTDRSLTCFSEDSTPNRQHFHYLFIPLNLLMLVLERELNRTQCRSSMCWCWHRLNSTDQAPNTAPTQNQANPAKRTVRGSVI